MNPQTRGGNGRFLPDTFPAFTLAKIGGKYQPSLNLLTLTWPVTPEVAGSSPVSRASEIKHLAPHTSSKSIRKASALILLAGLCSRPSKPGSRAFLPKKVYRPAPCGITSSPESMAAHLWIPDVMFLSCSLSENESEWPHANRSPSPPRLDPHRQIRSRARGCRCADTGPADPTEARRA